MVEDKFYRLRSKESFAWDGGAVDPVPNVREILDSTRAKSLRGYVYPPVITTTEETVTGTGISRREVLHSQRSSLLWRMQPTHELKIRSSDDKETLRRGLSGFVIHLLGMLYGDRCQFHNWWIDGRASLGTNNDIILPWGVVESICSTAIDTWTTWQERSQKVLINALYFHNRSPGLEWDWERFGHTYQAFDAIYAVAKAEHELPRTAHRARWQSVCDNFGLESHSTEFAEIVCLRNDLLHEVLWAGGMPGSDQLPVPQLTTYMRNFNTRFVIAVLGIDADYVRTDWRSLGQRVLRPVSPKF